MNPTPEQVSKVMQDTGMERLQAWNHLKQRSFLQARMRQTSWPRTTFPQQEPVKDREPSAEAVQAADLAIAKAMRK